MKIEQLTANLQSGSSKKKKIQSLMGLARLERKAKRAIPDIKPLLEDDDADVRLNALAAISIIAEAEVAEYAHAGIRDPAPMVRAYSAMLLSGLLGDKRTGYPVLRAMLRSSDPAERKAAAQYVDQAGEDFDIEKPCQMELDEKFDSGAKRTSGAVQTCTISCPISDNLEVNIALCDGETAPTAIQSKTIERLRGLSKSVKMQVRRELQRLLQEEGQWEEDELEAPLELHFLTALIPPLKDVDTAYFIVGGDSDYDVEHGFACLFKDGEQFCVCSADLMHASYACDDVEQFERVLAANKVVSLR